MESFTCDIRFEGETAYVNISGFLDENSRLNLADLGNAKHVIVNLRELKLMNSKGILIWMHWLRAQMKPGLSRSFIFVECPKPFVDQVNMVEGLVPPGTVIQSFFVPYICHDCDLPKDQLYESPKDFKAATTDTPGSWTTPDVKCPTCGLSMDVDVIEERYFKFLKHRAK